MSEYQSNFAQVGPSINSCRFKKPAFSILIVSENSPAKSISVSRKTILSLIIVLTLSIGGMIRGLTYISLDLEKVIAGKIELKRNNNLKADDNFLNSRLTSAVQAIYLESNNDDSALIKRSDLAVIINSQDQSLQIQKTSLTSGRSSGNDGFQKQLPFDDVPFSIHQPHFTCPVMGRISSFFGMRTDPIFEGSAWHYGIDIAGPPGTPISCTADGIVLYAGKKPRWGNVVIIDHYGSGYQTIYGHMKRYMVKRGDSISSGEVIGQRGNTGRSTGPHLHYEILYLGKPINPLPYLIPGDMIAD